MKTFLLLATIWNANGQAETHVMDYDMSGADCIAAIEQIETLAKVEVAPGLIVETRKATLACELDNANR